MAFDWKTKALSYIQKPANDADYYVMVEKTAAVGMIARAIGVYPLTKAENSFDHHALFVLLNQAGEVIRNFTVNWTWYMKGANEPANPIMCNKQEWEGPPGNLGLLSTMKTVGVWVGTVPGVELAGTDYILNLTTWWVSGEPAYVSQNNLYHRSFLCVWQLRDQTAETITEDETVVEEEKEDILAKVIAMLGEAAALLEELDDATV